MFYNVANNNGIGGFKMDNTQIRIETQNLIDRGRRLFNEGETVEEKDKGISIFL